VDLSDAIYTFQYLFLGGSAPTCLDAADANDDEDIDLSDGIYTLQYLYLGGPAPPPPGPSSAGVDPPDPAHPEALGCAEPQADGFFIEITLPEDFNRALITGLEIVFDTAPGGPPLDLPSGGGGGGLSTPSLTASVRSVDEDDDLEYVVALSGKPSPMDLFRFFVLAPPAEGRLASVRLTLLSANGSIASVIETHLSNGDPIEFPPISKTVLDLALTQCLSFCATSLNRAAFVTPPIQVFVLQKETKLSYRVAAYDPDGDPLTLKAAGLDELPGVPEFNAATHTFSWRPPAAAVREAPYIVGFEADDGRGGIGRGSLEIRVVTGNSTPVIWPIGPLFAVEGQRHAFGLNVQDPDGERVTLRWLAQLAVNIVDFLDEDEISTPFSFFVDYDKGRAEPYVIEFTATDPQGAATTQKVEVFVADVNRSPLLSGPDEVAVKAGVPTEVAITVDDPDEAQTFTFEVKPAEGSGCQAPSLPFESSVHENLINVRVSPGPNAVGKYCFRVNATDSAGGQASHKITINVNRTSSSPVIQPIPVQMTFEEETASFAVTATDADTETTALDFAMDASLLPAGHDAALAGSRFTWTPRVGDARSSPYGVAFTATDSDGASTRQTVFIGVRPRRRAPLSPPTFTGTLPASPAGDRNPSLLGTAPPGSTVRIYTSSDCSGAPVATGAADGSGAFRIAVSVEERSTTRFYASAVDARGNVSACSSEIAYTHESGRADLAVSSVEAPATASLAGGRVVFDGPIRYALVNQGNRDTPAGVRAEIFLSRSKSPESPGAVRVRDEALESIPAGGALIRRSSNSPLDPAVALAPGSYFLLVRVNPALFSDPDPSNNAALALSRVQLAAAAGTVNPDIVIADVRAPTAAIVGQDGLVRLTLRHLPPPSEADAPRVVLASDLTLRARVFLSQDDVLDPAGDAPAGEETVVFPAGPGGRDLDASVRVAWVSTGVQRPLPARLRLLATVSDEGQGNGGNNLRQSSTPFLLYDIDQVILEGSTGGLLPDVGSGAQPILLGGTDFRPAGAGRLPVGEQVQFAFVVPTAVPARTQMVVDVRSQAFDPIAELLGPDGRSIAVSDDSLRGTAPLIYTPTDVSPDLPFYFLRITAAEETVGGAFDITVNLNPREASDVERVQPVVIGDVLGLIRDPPAASHVYRPGELLGRPVPFDFETNNEAEFFFHLSARARLTLAIPRAGPGATIPAPDLSMTRLTAFPPVGTPYEVALGAAVDANGGVSFSHESAPRGPLVLEPASCVLVLRTLAEPQAGETFSLALHTIFEGPEAARVFPAPAVIGSVPSSPSRETRPAIHGLTRPRATVRVHASSDCSGPAAASGAADASGRFDIVVTAPENRTTTFSVRAEDEAGIVSECSAPLDYEVDTVPPRAAGFDGHRSAVAIRGHRAEAPRHSGAPHEADAFHPGRLRLQRGLGILCIFGHIGDGSGHALHPHEPGRRAAPRHDDGRRGVRRCALR